MTLFPTLPEPAPVPPWLRWQYGEILYDDGETLSVHVEVYLLPGGWTWSAKLHRYHRQHDGTHRAVRHTDSAEAGHTTEQAAKAAAEKWIVAEVTRG